MARPRKADARDHQINLRFTAPEIVKIHHHAAITGKTVTEFGRTVLLRRPRRRNGAVEPNIIALPDEALARWHAVGARLNAIAHLLNSRDVFPPRELFAVLLELRSLLKRSFPSLVAPGGETAPYALAPPVRYHLRKVGTNLAQIKSRHEQLGFEVPRPLVRLLEQIRGIMNGDQPLHGP